MIALYSSHTGIRSPPGASESAVDVFFFFLRNLGAISEFKLIKTPIGDGKEGNGLHARSQEPHQLTAHTRKAKLRKPGKKRVPSGKL
jgi:hypothetical protein